MRRFFLGAVGMTLMHSHPVEGFICLWCAFTLHPRG